MWSASHQLVQGWVHTSSTEVAGASALLSVGSNRQKIHNMYSSYEVQIHDLLAVAPSRMTWEQAVYGVFYTYKWLQFPVTNIISTVCTCTEEMVHRGGKGKREYPAAV